MNKTVQIEKKDGKIIHLVIRQMAHDKVIRVGQRFQASRDRMRNSARQALTLPVSS
jgi:hypothetical protein